MGLLNLAVGEKVADKNCCPKCENELKEGDLFCPECGHHREEKGKLSLSLFVIPTARSDKAILLGVAVSVLAMFLPWVSVAHYFSLSAVKFWFSWVFILTLVAVAAVVLLPHKLPGSHFFVILPFGLGCLSLGICSSILGVVGALNALIGAIASGVAGAATQGASSALEPVFGSISVVNMGFGFWLFVAGSMAIVYGGYLRTQKRNKTSP